MYIYIYMCVCVCVCVCVWVGQVAQSVLATALRAVGSGVRIPVVSKFSPPIQSGPEAYPASCKTCAGSFPGVKRPERDAGPSPLPVPRSKIE